MIKRQTLILIFVASICFIIGSITGIYIGRSRGIPFVRKLGEWSIGIYTGQSPFHFYSPPDVSNPVLTAKDVRDVPALFVADPFMVRDNSTWFMFFEVMNAQTSQGDIGLAISNDGLNWTYKQIVLDELFHLSYPYVFKWKNEYYMIPESFEANAIRLYKATTFPTEWSYVGSLIEGKLIDPSIFHYDEKWWMFAADLKGNDTLRLYYANNLRGPWIEHPKSPIIEHDANIARPGGRTIVWDGRIVRYTQDDVPTYGNQVRAFEIIDLSTTSYKELEVSENPIIKASGDAWSWNGQGMHHIDPHKVEDKKWIAVVDGRRDRVVFGLKY